MKVLIVDQFSGITPYELRQSPRRFDELCDEVLADFSRRNEESITRGGLPLWYGPKIAEVDEDFRPEMSTTVVRANADGYAEVWKTRWDSSG